MLSTATRRFHPFQGRPSFGQKNSPGSLTSSPSSFPSLSGKTFIRTCQQSRKSNYSGTRRFHPFQGRPSFGRRSGSVRQRQQMGSFHPFQGRPSFGPQRTLIRWDIHTGFHPFQGRPSFGLKAYMKETKKIEELFPSLSGKTFIRTEGLHEGNEENRRAVSIPFREDLHSDTFRSTLREEDVDYCFHPFQGRPSFGHFVAGSVAYEPGD